MSGYQPNAYPESRPARLIQRDGGEVIETGWLISSQIYDDADEEREPMELWLKVAMGLTVATSFVTVVGCLGWLINNFFPHLWSAL